MGQNKVYLMVTITAPNIREFNIFWTKEALPHWLKYGKHIGSFTNWVGGPRNQIIRLFEFESLAKWEEFQEWMSSTPEGQEMTAGIEKHNIVGELRLLRVAPIS